MLGSIQIYIQIYSTSMCQILYNLVYLEIEGVCHIQCILSTVRVIYDWDSESEINRVANRLESANLAPKDNQRHGNYL